MYLLEVPRLSVSSKPVVGQIVLCAESLCGAGWDACFEHDGQTYAEMVPEEKNKISHRGKALDTLKQWLKEEV